MGDQTWQMGTDMGPVQFSTINDPLSWSDSLCLLTIERNGDQITSIRMKVEAFEIAIKDGWLVATPKATP